MPNDGSDTQVRAAAFAHAQFLMQIHGTIPAAKLYEGFDLAGQRIPFVNPQRGIFKPRSMRHLLSIRTVHPKPGGKVWYDDQREIHRRIFGASETFSYDFMGNNPDAAENQWMREAMISQVPIIYFLGVAPARYQAIVPTYIVGWDARALRAEIAFGLADKLMHAKDRTRELGVADPGSAYLAGAPLTDERRYALRTVKQRLHQAYFREAVLSAYRGRCAFSGLPEPLLLDAAHIVEDRDERWGQPSVANGLPLSKVHHAAFDAHLIGVDPDYRIHVSERLLHRHDGEILRALQGLNGGKIHLPRREQDAPSRERLEMRFAQYKAVG
jgi:putative restriction endonuclease